MIQSTDSVISLRQLGAMLLARRRTIQVVFLVTLFLAGLLSVTLPKRYTASAAVVLDGRAKDPIDGSAVMSLSIPGYLATQTGIIKSERVSLDVIRTLHVDAMPEYREGWQSETDGHGDYASWLSEKLIKKLEVKPNRDSSIIDISYTHRNAQFATDLVNAYVHSYIKTSLELQVDPAKQSYGFFDERKNQARDDLENAQRKLSEFRQAAGILTTDEHLDIENSKLADLSSKAVAQRVAADEAANRARQAALHPDNMSDVTNDHLVIALQDERLRKEDDLAALKQRLGAQHPQVLEAQASLAKINAQFEQESARALHGMNTGLTISRVALNETIDALEAQRKLVLGLKLKRDEAGVLQRDVENAQKAYDTVIDRSMVTNLQSQSTQNNVSVLKLATIPGEASFPRLGLNLVLAGLLGLLLSLPVALVRELRDRRIHTDEDVLMQFQLPVLSTLPRMALGDTSKDSSRSLSLKARVLGVPHLVDQGNR